jgi:GDP-L-fucose synthase
VDIEKDSKIYIAGHTGMVGSAIYRKLREKGFNNIIKKTRKKLNLMNQQSVCSFYNKYQPEYVFICAAKVGGIYANNTYRADFLYENIQIQNNLIHYAYESGVKKLLFLGSSCIYPRNCQQPIKEEYLLTGRLEQTNEPYAIAKISGIKMCESYYKQYKSNFMSIMPTNTYGPNDNYDLLTGHVFAALIRKFHEAKVKNIKIVKLWGTGTPKREFIYVDDLAAAAVFIINLDFNLIYDQGISHINIGSGEEISIKNLAKRIAKEVDYNGKIEFDKSKPNGTLNKLMDSSRINNFGWEKQISLEEGIQLAYNSFLNESNN